MTKFFLILLLSTPVFAKEAGVSSHDGFYHWHCDASESSQYIEIKSFLSHTEISSLEIPVCMLPKRTERTVGDDQVIVAFYFINRDSSLGENGELIEVNIWQAGAEPDAVILGVSLQNSRKIIVNTLHVVKLDPLKENKVIFSKEFEMRINARSP